MKQNKIPLFSMLLLAVIVSTGMVCAASQNATTGQIAPAFKLVDSHGKTHELSDYKGKYVVLEWTNYQCPFVRKHYETGNMQSLQKTYTDKGVIWLSICSSATGNQGYFQGEELKRKVKDVKSNATAYLQDTKGLVGRQYGAKTTPHMFIIDPQGTLIYAGAIDDKPSARKSDVEGAKNYVSEVLDHALNGKTPPVKATTSYGCSVKY